MSRHDAIVIGAGPNGLVAANVLADHGWDVIVLEAADKPGGAVRTEELTLPGYRNDLFSAFYPLAPLSPSLAPLRLEEHGLEWARTPLVVAHPAMDGTCATLSQDLDETAESLDRFHPGDGDAWRRSYGTWQKTGRHLVDALFGAPFPPVKAGAAIAKALGPRELTRFLRFGLLPIRRYAEEEFGGVGGARLLAGNALHADVTPDSTGSALYGWLLCMLGQDVGYPFPRGGAQGITDALVRRLHERGGKLECGQRVTRVVVEKNRAVGVETAAGGSWTCRRAVLADVPAPTLYEDLVGREHLPASLRMDLKRFQYDNSTVKVDWALSKPIPWAAQDARRAGTVHVTEGIDALTMETAQIASGLIPAEPFLVLGQYASGDTSRAPEGGEAAWAYTHVPQRVKGDAGPDELTGAWDERETEIYADRMESMVERLAPGFRECIRARHVFSPRTMESANPSLVGGAINDGTAQLHQQLIFRPVTGLGRPETFVRGLFLASASAHPGGGVHGAPGANAAKCALRPVALGSRALQWYYET